MRKANYKKKQQLKNIGTATALTITLATSNVPTLAYAMELENDINEEVVVEEVVVEEEEKKKKPTTQEEINIQEEVTVQEEVVEKQTVEITEKEESVEVATEEVKKDNATSTVGNFNLAEWDYKMFSKTIVLDKYKGDKTDVVIPGQITVTEADVQNATNIADLKNCPAGDKVVKMGTMNSSQSNDCFYGKRNTITSLKFEKINGKKVEFSSITKNTFTNFTSLTDIDLRGADISNLSDASNMFSGCVALESVNLSGLSLPNMTTMSNMFAELTNLKYVNLNVLDTYSVTTMYNMFKGCTSLQAIDLSGLDTSSVTNMTGLFLGCSSLSNITFGGKFKTNSVQTINNMFKDCTSLQTVDISSFDTTSVTNMSYMFSDSGLTDLNLNNFNTSGVLNMKGMFRNTENLTNITFGTEFKTSSVNDMSFMFCNTGVSKLDLSNFETSQVKDMTAMFGSLDNIDILDLSNSKFVLGANIKNDFMFAKHISVASANNNIVEKDKSSFEKPFLVISSDDTIKAHDFSKDACLPVGLTLDANSGIFANGQTVAELKTNVVDRFDESTIDTEIQKVLDNAIPTRNEHRFVTWEIKTKSSSVLDRLNKTYVAKWERTPSAPNYDVDDNMGVIPETPEPPVDIEINNAPTIQANNKTIKVGTKFNPLDDVKAFDAEDGDITDKIKVVSNNVNTSKTGNYEVVYEVIDSKGVITSKVISVIVVSDNKPVIIGVEDIEIIKGSNFDPMEGVSAFDCEDGDITEKIIILGSVNTDKPGKYNIIYRVSDKENNITEFVRQVLVYDNKFNIVDNPKTGEEENTILWLATGALALIGIIFLNRKKK